MVSRVIRWETSTITHSVHCRKGCHTHIWRDEIHLQKMKICYDVELAESPGIRKGSLPSHINMHWSIDSIFKQAVSASPDFAKRTSTSKMFNPLATFCPEDIKMLTNFVNYWKSWNEQRILDGQKSPSKHAQEAQALLSPKVIFRLALNSYCDAIGYIRTKISLALWRSFTLCIRGYHSVRRPNFEESSMSTVVFEEGKLSWFIWTSQPSKVIFHLFSI